MIYTKRIESIDGVLNRTLVAEEITKELCSIGAISSTNADLVEAISTYAQNFLVNTFSLVELMSVDAKDIVCRIYEEIATDFAKSHVELSNKYGVETIKDFFTDNTYNLTDLFEMVFVNCEDTEKDFCDYVGYEGDEENEVEEEVSYKFKTDVHFRITCDENDDVDCIEREINKRIGKGACYKWRAADLLSTCYVYVGDHYEGMLTLNIKGNDTYTEDTIETAIHNRLGANAKRKAWDEFEVVAIYTERI